MRSSDEGLNWKSKGTLCEVLPADPKRNQQPRQVLGAAYSRVTPMRLESSPSLLIGSPEMAELLGTGPLEKMLGLLSGQVIPSAIQPYAMCYGGHQFGHWAGQLGDGRAIVLGEAVDLVGKTQTLQLKGAGQTPYSRGADGRAVLRSSIREFLCSEAMHYLGIPTTRALSLVRTNDRVLRDMFYDGRPGLEPGAIVCRVAPSFLRFGSLELPAARGDTALVQSTIDYLVDAHFPEIRGEGAERTYALLSLLAERTAALVVDWMRVGFVHGVLNTDNMSMHGLTIDYGPYGWLEEYDLQWTPNTTDAQGRRYAFGAQPNVALWNLTRLAEALFCVVDDVDRLKACLALYKSSFETEYSNMLLKKCGLAGADDPIDGQLIGMLADVLSEGRFDYTQFFHRLQAWSHWHDASSNAEPEQVRAHFSQASYANSFSTQSLERLTYFLQLYAERLRRTGTVDEERTQLMQSVNPQFVLRNYLVAQAIEAAEKGDDDMVYALLETARRPYERRAGSANHYQKMPEWARNRPGCSMLSCSS